MAVTTEAPALGTGARAWRTALAVVAALIAGGLLLQVFDPRAVPALQNFFVVFGSLLVEALPFILLGAAVSALIEVFVPSSLFARMARLPKGVQMPVAGFGGFAFPVCECGSVPVARRLALKGLTPGAAVTFMLAAPILNPIVLVSTAVAYRGRGVMWPMVLGRAGLGLAAALAVGWIVGARTRGELLKAPRGSAEDGGHGHAELGHVHQPSGPPGPPHDPHGGEGRWAAYFGHLAGDFVLLSRYLVVGGAVAAALQTFLPQSVLGSVASTPVVDIVALMALAGVLSLCSESDAFVAASFVQFGPAAQLGFLVFGPMVDAKLGFLYAGTFSRGFLRVVILAVGAVTLVGALWMELLTG